MDSLSDSFSSSYVYPLFSHSHIWKYKHDHVQTFLYINKWICSSKAEQGQTHAHTAAVPWIMRTILHICPPSGPSISSINHNYFFTCKVRIINTHVTAVINRPCAAAAPRLFWMTHKDTNNYTVCPAHRGDAPWLVTDSLFILRALLFHCTRGKMGSLALNMRMWEMKILGGGGGKRRRWIWSVGNPKQSRLLADKEW